MRFPFYIARRIIRNETRSFSRLIIVIARIAIALSLAVMIVASSMVNGFRDTISSKIYGFWGHINISKESLRSSFDDLPIPYDTAFMEWAAQQDAIETVQVYARKAGIIKKGGSMEGVILKGVDDHFYWDGFRQYIIAGDTLSYNSDSGEDMLLSRSVAERMQLQVGDSALLHFIDNGSQGNFRQRYKRFRVAGIYNTGLEEFDKLFALVDIRQIRDLNNWNGNEVGGYEVFLKDPSDMQAVADEVQFQTNPFWNVQTVYQLIPGIFDWLNLQKINERIILILMLVVAVINMITSLLILILERTRMIGSLKAMGATNGNIRWIFLFKSAHIIIWGLVLGNLLGLGICYLQQTFGIIRLPEASYYVTVAPVAIRYGEILLINAGTLVVSLAFLVIPSVLVARIDPVKALRFN